MDEKLPKDPTCCDSKSFLADVTERLRECGIDLSDLCCDEATGGTPRVVCIAANLGASMSEMAQRPRAETVMVRIDQETRTTLDAWLETGYFKSRSEAAALFIREGLKVRASELEKLKESLRGVELAKAELHQRARAIFGDKQ